jgi:hypothetical protein
MQFYNVLNIFEERQEIKLTILENGNISILKMFVSNLKSQDIDVVQIGDTIIINMNMKFD